MSGPARVGEDLERCRVCYAPIGMCQDVENCDEMAEARRRADERRFRAYLNDLKTIERAERMNDAYDND